MSRPNEPLSPEERDLAARLARLGGPREPAPALDAMILAAARAAVSGSAPVGTPITGAPPTSPAAADPKVTQLRPRTPGPRWPLGFGLAASLVLAAGIGWRLQGDGDGSSAESAMASMSAADNDEAVRAVILEPSLQREAPPPPPPLEQDVANAPAAAVSQAPAAKVAAAPSEPQFVADAPMADAVMHDKAPAVASPAPPPHTSAGSAAASRTTVAADEGALDSVTVTGSRISADRTVGAAEYTRTPLGERREQANQLNKFAPPEAPVDTSAKPAPVPARQSAPPAAASTAKEVERMRGVLGTVKSDAEERKTRDGDRFDDRPPVTADSPAFRQAWLQRIRALIAKGEQPEALDSLQEFRRRYPNVELPDDLKALAATLPPPTP